MKSHPKIQTIVEAISRNEVVVALKDINSLLSKQKTKEKLSPDVLETITLLRALCQVRTEQFGDARKILRDFMKTHAQNHKIDEDIQAWLGYLASGTGLFDEIRAFMEPLKPKELADEKAAVNQMGLVVKHYDFKGAQNAALKVYKDYKQPKYMLASIMFNYLAVTKGPNASKDLVKDLNLPCMFINKLKDDLKITEEKQALENTLNRQVIKLYVEILFRQNKRDQVLDFLKKFSRVFEDNYEVYFNYLLALYKENPSKDVFSAILAKYTEIFRANNNLDTFRLCYNLYKQCTSFFISNIAKETVAGSANIALEAAEKNAGKDYEFTEDADFTKLLGIFWNSLGQSLQIFESNFKEHQHYRNAVKAVLTCKLEILREIMFSKKEQGKSATEDAIVKEYTDILKLYTKHFLRIFTFADEVFPSLTLLTPAALDQYLSFLEQEVAQLPEKTRCIGDVNYLKLVAALKNTHTEIDQVENEVISLIGKYTEAMKIVYDNKKIVEKGERLDNDEYIVLLVDIVLKFLDQKDVQNLDERTFGLVIKTWYILELALEKTPYNFDLKLKAMQLYGRFSVTEKVLDIYKTTDIKAVQTDTLGYIFYNLHSSLYLTEPIFDYLRDNIRFHVESQKESRESLMACIKHENLSSVEEFYEWDRLMQRSYMKHISYLHFAEREFKTLLRKEATSEAAGELVNMNLEYFLEHIFKRYNAQVAGDNFEKFTLNFDVKVPQRNIVAAAHTDQRLTSVFPVDTKKVGKTHIDYLTVLNNPAMLGLKAYRLDILYTIIQANEAGKTERLQKVLDGYKETLARVNLEGFFDLRQFERRTKDSALLQLNDKEGYEYSFIKEVVEFELDNYEFELAFINLYSFWLDVILKKEEKDGEALIKSVEEKYEKVLVNLEKAFQAHLKEPWRIFATDLRKLGRFVEETIETLVLVGAGINNMKSAVTKIVKKFNDAKQFTNLFKTTQTTLKTLKDRTDTTLEGINAVLVEVGGGLKGNEGYLLKDHLVEVDKLFNAEVYNVAHVRKNFVTDLNRSYQYTLSTFADRIKAQSKGLKSLIIA